MRIVRMLICFRGDTNALAYSGELREDNDIKQEVIAKLLNVSQATYSRYETRELNIPIESLIELARFYGTSIDYLVGITDNPNSI